MQINQTVQDKKTGKLYLVVGIVGKHNLELKEVTHISIQLHVNSNGLLTVFHHSQFEPCKQVNINVDGRILDVISKA